jgi:site-specific DNA recombinase
VRGYLHKILKNPFYDGFFKWNEKIYPGTHELIIPGEIRARVKEVFSSLNRPRYRKHSFAFANLLTCAHDSCSITAEIKKGKYTYYRCTGYRGKCDTPYFREEEISSRLGELLKNIHIPDTVAAAIERSLESDRNSFQSRRKAEEDRLQKRLTEIRGRMDRAYTDKLDGKITEEFWNRKSAEWIGDEQHVQMALMCLSEATYSDCVLNAKRILELANKAYFLYLTQKPEEQAKLLKLVLSNCAIDGANLYPTYRKPFDLIFERAKKEEWRARRDSNSRPNAPEAFALSS